MYDEMKQQRLYYGSFLNAMLALFFIQLLRSYEKDILFLHSQQKKQNENLIFILKYIENNFMDIANAR